MISVNDLMRIVGQAEGRLQNADSAVKERLTRDLSRARLYLKAIRTGHSDLIPDRHVRDLLQRYPKRPEPASEDVAAGLNRHTG